MKYVFYNPANGAILSAGEMQESNLDSMIEQGYAVIKTGERLYPVIGYKVDLETKQIVVDPVDPTREPAVKAAIRDELLRTDYTQATDASEHITESAIAEYRDYRRVLREAYNKPDFVQIVLALPERDPTGNDPFGRFRRLITLQEYQSATAAANTAANTANSA
jgi:hypothetical protein